MPPSRIGAAFFACRDILTPGEPGRKSYTCAGPRAPSRWIRETQKMRLATAVFPGTSLARARVSSPESGIGDETGRRQIVLQ